MNRHQKKPLTDRAWLAGFATALAEVHRRAKNSSVIVEAARDAGLTTDGARAAGVSDFDAEELYRAGVA